MNDADSNAGSCWCEKCKYHGMAGHALGMGFMKWVQPVWEKIQKHLY